MKTLVIKTNDITLGGTQIYTELVLNKKLVLNKNAKEIIEVSAKIGSALKEGKIDTTSLLFEENNVVLNNDEVLRIISHLKEKKKLHMSNIEHVINIGFEEEDKDSCFLFVKSLSSFIRGILGGVGTGMLLNKNDIKKLIEFLQ